MHDSFIMHYAYGDLGELEERDAEEHFMVSLKGHQCKSEIGVMLPSSFDGMDVMI